MKSVFNENDANELIARIEKLSPDSKPNWGKMSVDRMLAHCNVAYDLTYEDKYPKPNFFKKFLLKNFVKKYIVSEAPYQQSLKTDPVFIITDSKNFSEEKARLIGHLKKTLSLGEKYFEGRESHSFGVLTAQEWNNMFYKHINHHLTQFGV